jgi:hypothetical protein
MLRLRLAPLTGNLLRHRQEPPEEREPCSRVVAYPCQRIEHDGANGVEEQVVLGWFIRAASGPCPVAGVTAH